MFLNCFDTTSAGGCFSSHKQPSPNRRQSQNEHPSSSASSSNYWTSSNPTGSSFASSSNPSSSRPSSSRPGTGHPMVADLARRQRISRESIRETNKKRKDGDISGSLTMPRRE
ncbi:hypothetical protein niasHS_011680 [Heterodera schachtii]|uniref:Uncharacterized protein n=1 Tax=Heterodera schachtii TaxID=97005 RepID=A0ABD2IQE3_HETSC